MSTRDHQDFNLTIQSTLVDSPQHCFSGYSLCSRLFVHPGLDSVVSCETGFADYGPEKSMLFTLRSWESSFWASRCPYPEWPLRYISSHRICGCMWKRCKFQQSFVPHEGSCAYLPLGSFLETRRGSTNGIWGATTCHGPWGIGYRTLSWTGSDKSGSRRPRCYRTRFLLSTV